MSHLARRMHDVGFMINEKLEGLWTTACQAMASGQLGEARKAVDELLLEAKNGNVVADMLPLPSCTALASSDWSVERLQPLTDRVECLNMYVSNR